MDIKSHPQSSCSSSSSAAKTYLTPDSFTDVISSTARHADVTAMSGCDLAVRRHYEDWDAGDTSDKHSATNHATSLVVSDMASPNANTPAFCDAIATVAAEPPRCLDNGSDVTSSGTPSSGLTQLSVGVKHESAAVCNVGDDYHLEDNDVIQRQFPVGTYNDVIVKRDDERLHEDRTSSEMMLPSSDDIQPYFSTVDRPRSIESFITHSYHPPPAPHHHHHHGYYQHHLSHQQHVYPERLSSSEVSLTSDAKQQFYTSLYNYSAECRVTEMSLPLQQSLVTAASYQQSATPTMSNARVSSLTGLIPVHVTTSETSRSTLVPMLCYSPSTSSSSLLAESQREGASDGGVSESFSALLHSSPVTQHVYLGDSGVVDNGDRPHAIDTLHAADMMDTTSLPYYDIMQPSSCYSDDQQMTAWNSSGIATLMKSFAGADYQGLSLELVHSF